MPMRIYEPQEDSFLLQDVLIKKIHAWKETFGRAPDVLDMGTGTGILAATALEEDCKVVAVDKNPDAVAWCKERLMPWIKAEKLELRGSDLFQNIHESFDLIVFNPPYLPTEPKDPDMALDGGEKGYEIILRFLHQAKDHLTEKGSILLLFSSRSHPEVILKTATQQQYHYHLHAQADFFFDHLYVYEFLRKTRKEKGLLRPTQ